jgi:hypothetical protein
MSEHKHSSSCGCGKPSSSCSTPKASTPAPSAIQNGKGDAPRNISETFRDNYNGIRWSEGGRKRQEGRREVKVYGRS